MNIEVPFHIKHEVVEVFNKKTQEKSFLMKKNNEWEEITEDEYNKITGVK